MSTIPSRKFTLKPVNENGQEDYDVYVDGVKVAVFEFSEFEDEYQAVCEGDLGPVVTYEYDDEEEVIDSKFTSESVRRTVLNTMCRDLDAYLNGLEEPIYTIEN